ncbi:uncharacterized protein A1O9_10553 [Exophiala aquamarina CBS 119918]|uniref:NCS1 family nucleobase:cation symporter-1 n=1 Tax=Exophiala aquamarina CBS 119918 TaxID=1182545 RepID=A0A072P2T1_9EURO|nr:uncharacterized protein A1O9_10553 [Exophiala aquamarina CBS 119918]KEF53578.1 hypothetical protein A1O9_10553 [Exophiala aquamarina CBS 119918]
MPLAGLGMVLWSTLSNGEIDSTQLEDSDGPRIPPTAILAWGITSQFNAVIGINSALLVTVPDLARYSKTSQAQAWGQLIGLPLGQTLCGVFGVITTSAVRSMYGEAYWNPDSLLDAILDHSHGSKARAGVFFASACFAFATLGTSIACNFIPFAADVTSLLPQYINIVRGQLLCLFIAFAIVPWQIVATANGFLNFIDGYSIFQFPITAIMIVDYFALRHGNLTVADLYNAESSGTYFCYYGFNLRAFCAFVIGFTLPLPGLIGSFGHSFSIVSDRLYSLGWFLSLTMGSLSYYVACRVWPVPGHDRDHPFEAKVTEHTTWNISDRDEMDCEMPAREDQVSKEATAQHKHQSALN